jgi:DNA-binding CsgD family transcriptional regulator/PAS domain-containing protein
LSAAAPQHESWCEEKIGPVCMGDAEAVSALVGDIYDAALDATLWPAVLGKTTAFAGGHAAGLYAKDVTSKTGNIYYDDGVIDRQYVQLYFDKYVRFDPSTTGHFFAEIGKPMATADLMDYDEFLQTRFYKEWAQPQRLVDHLAVVLDKSATSVALFGVFRHERDGVADETMRSRMRLIAPHMRRAVLIGRAIELKTTQTDNLARSLDGLATGMFLVEEDGRIVHANAAGIAMLNAADFLRSNGGRLSAADADTDQALRETFLAASRGDTHVGANGIAHAMMSRSGDRYVAHVLPLASDARRRATPSSAAAALFVQKAELGKVAAPEAMAKTYKLTPTELRVLLATAEVNGGTPEMADALGIAETTVKFHLRRLFSKTGVNRQADLVKIVAGFVGPLAG